MPTSALYGFTGTLFRILEKEKPDLMAVVFDSDRATFRHEKYAAYKATRDKMPDELSDQIPYIQKISEAMKIPYLVLPGYEADDIIGTLVKRAEKEGIESYMVSGDKDFLQLVSKKTFLYNMKKGAEVEICGTEGPQHKWGVSAEHVTDLLALMGDSSDNVPGVPGVGEKTATKLIQKFGSIENLYQKLDEVEPKGVREKLAANHDQAKLCKELVTIDTNVPIQIDVKDLHRNGFDVPRLTVLLQELDFHNYLTKLAAMQTSRTSQETECYELIDSEEKLKKLLKELQDASFFAFDTETTSLHPRDAKPIGVSVSSRPKCASYVPEKFIESMKAILEDPKKKKGGQNTKFDRLALKNEGIEVQGIVFDTMLESYLIDPSSRQHGLDTLALKHLQLQKILTSELIGKGKSQISMLDVDIQRITHYACEDADCTFRLHEIFAPQIEAQELLPLYRDVELPLAQVLGDMEYEGIALDVPFLKKLSTTMNARLDQLKEEIYKVAGVTFNLNSPKQLGPILYEKLKIQAVAGGRVKKTKTGYSTDQEVLETYAAHPIVKLLLEYRNLQKLLSTYIDCLPDLIHPVTKRIHTSFNQTVAATGRLSSSDPNLQNIPIRSELGKEIRKAFVAGHPGWKMMSADYSQIELRLLAHLSGDPNLTDAFQKNEDVHRRTASLIFGVSPDQVDGELRNRAKTINFGVIYGMGSQRLARETGISMAEAKDFITAYFDKYAKVKRYLDTQIEFAKEKGYVKTLLGRRRDIPEINSDNPRLQSNAERIATNTPIQGSAADLIKVAMVRIHNRLKQEALKCRMLIQVHDELVFELPEEEIEQVTKLVKSEMEDAMSLKVPLLAEVGVGNNWAEAH
jgi:DNA polymerase I